VVSSVKRILKRRKHWCAYVYMWYFCIFTYIVRHGCWKYSLHCTL